MSDLRHHYRPKSPAWLQALLILVGAMSAAVLVTAVVSLWRGPLFSQEAVEALGQQGDFFGGHITALVSSVTLFLVIYTTYAQDRANKRFFMRSYFLEGAQLISQSKPKYKAGSPDMFEPFRLIDYYSRVALSDDDDELYLILNAVVSGEVRKELEEPAPHTKSSFPYAVEALAKIAAIQERSGKARSATKA